MTRDEIIVQVHDQVWRGLFSRLERHVILRFYDQAQDWVCGPVGEIVWWNVWYLVGDHIETKIKLQIEEKINDKR